MSSSSVTRRYLSCVYTVSPLHMSLQAGNFQRCEHVCPGPVGQLLYWTSVIFKILYWKIKNGFFIFCVCFLCMCEKYYEPIMV